MGASMAWREMSRVVLVKGEQNNSLARFRTKGTGLSLVLVLQHRTLDRF